MQGMSKGSGSQRPRALVSAGHRFEHRGPGREKRFWETGAACRSPSPAHSCSTPCYSESTGSNKQLFVLIFRPVSAVSWPTWTPCVGWPHPAPPVSTQRQVNGPRDTHRPRRVVFDARAHACCLKFINPTPQCHLETYQKLSRQQSYCAPACGTSQRSGRRSRAHWTSKPLHAAVHRRTPTHHIVRWFCKAVPMLDRRGRVE